MLCAFEPVKYCIAAPRLSGSHEAQVGLVAAAQPHARLGVALAEHALDARVGDEGVHHGLAVAADAEDVDVAAGLAPAAQAADRDELGRRRRARAGG